MDSSYRARICRPRRVPEEVEDCLVGRPTAAQPEGGAMPLRMRVHDREPIGAALRRFKKLIERSGLQEELRKGKYYEKPSEVRRRAAHRKATGIHKGKQQS